MKISKGRPVTRLAALGACGLVALAATGCGSSSSSGSKSSGGDYVIGLSAGITGPAAAIVKGEITGIQAYIAQVNGTGGINGHRLKLVTADTQNQATNAAATFTQLATSDHIIAAIGDVLADNCQAQIPVAQRYKVPVLCGTLDPAQLEPPQPYTYVEYGDEDTQVGSIVKAMTDSLSLSSPKVALVYVKSASTVPFFQKVTNAVKAAGGSIVLDDQLGSTLDLTVDAAKVKSSGAQVVVEQVIPQQLQSLAQGLQNGGTNVPIIGEATTASYPEMMLLKNPNLYQLALSPFVDPNGSEPAVKAYTQALEQTAQLSGKSAINGQSIAQTYAATAFLAEALKACGSNCNGEKLNTAMEHTSLNLPGVNTDFSFAPGRHYAQTSFLLYKYDATTSDVKQVGEPIPGTSLSGS